MPDRAAATSTLKKAYLWRRPGLERRAWDSNPQPLAGHHISSVAASHSLTLRAQKSKIEDLGLLIDDRARRPRLQAEIDA